MSLSRKLLYRSILFESKSSFPFNFRKLSYEKQEPRHEKNSQLSSPNQRIFSGIQPTGILHLGNYFGAVRQWAQNQNENTIYSIVDLHSITLPQDPKELKENILKMAASLLACGLDHEKCIVFQQSKVPQHTELSWVLGCLTTLPRLGQLPQFKEKSAKMKEIPLGLYVYPVLQSADILLYKATQVPCGEDNFQHIQLAQHLAKLFNNKFGTVFPRPSAVAYDDFSSRLKSLRDPLKKMSKSDPNSKSRIELTDNQDEVVEKCKKALTDFNSNVTFEPETRPAVANLIILHSLCSGLDPHTICHQSSHLTTAEYKLVVAEAVNELLQPIRQRYLQLLNEPAYLISVLDIGAEKATKIAEKTWMEVQSAIGFTLSS